MLPEEKFKKEIWDVLQEIKANRLNLPNGTKIELSGGEGAVGWRRSLITGQLDHWGAIKEDIVFNKNKKDIDLLVLTIKQPKFNRIYEKYKYEFCPKIQIVEREIVKETFIDNRIKANDKPHYESGVLFFAGKEINFNRKTNQKELLDTLFKQPTKKWFYDEVQEDWDPNWDGVKKNNSKSKDFWRKFYHAGNDINHNIAEETQIKDFISKNTGGDGWIRITQKYV